MPVYNDEEYVSGAIKSILDQTLNDIEIICVDDGSTDGSGQILDDFAEKYDFIKVIHQENQGAAACRNKAILEATGQYITFLDSDDFNFVVFVVFCFVHWNKCIRLPKRMMPIWFLPILKVLLRVKYTQMAIWRSLISLV